MTRQVPAGRAIEEASFRIIEAEVGNHSFDAEAWRVVRRMVHATADLDFARNAALHPLAVATAVSAFGRGCAVVCDVRMLAAGLSVERLGRAGCVAHCFVADRDVAEEARARGTTRSAEAMRKAHRLGLLEGGVVAVGNAPTALMEIVRLVRDERARPALVIGVPVGFVGAAESKEAALGLSVPWLVVRGRKGGTPAAVAAVHALLDLTLEKRGEASP